MQNDDNHLENGKRECYVDMCGVTKLNPDTDDLRVSDWWSLLSTLGRKDNQSHWSP